MLCLARSLNSFGFVKVIGASLVILRGGRKMSVSAIE